MILVNKKEVRILFVPCFLPGAFANEGINIKEIEDKKGIKYEKGQHSRYIVSMGEDLLRDLSLKAEVEKGNRFLDGNIRYTETAERQNFSHTIVSSDNNILVLGREDVLLATLYYWEDYLNYIQHKCGWLV